MIKLGVSLKDLQPQMAIAYAIIQDIYRQFGYGCTITSGNDGVHMPGSCHGTGDALDFRTKHLERPDFRVMMEEIKVALGQEFDVVIENVGEPNEHAHVEWQLRGTRNAAVSRPA